MKKKFKLGVIGAGFMATAIVKGVISAGVLDASAICVSDVSESALEKISKLSVHTCLDSKALANDSEFLLFAVKPQNLDSVLASINGANCEKFISIMAGVKSQKIKQVFNGAKVARCMPNTPCAVESGAIGIDLSDFEEGDADFLKSLLLPIASVVEVEENKLNIVTGISGSAPAYFYLFLKGIIDAGIKRGLGEKESIALATSTMIGAGKMVLNNPDKTIDELILAVCSKGGTTIEAVKVFNGAGLGDITDKAIDACIKRAGELENL